MDSQSTRQLLMWQMTLSFFFVSGISDLARAQQTKVLAHFIFGDSLVDSGNNNYIASLARADFPSNGIDFAGGVGTGRFSNGRHMSDIMGEQFNLSYIPVYLDPSTRGPVILKGVNYASGGAGIVDDTGYNIIGRIPLSKQLANFQETRMQIVQMVGPEAAADLFNQSLFSVTIGSNDYLNNYFIPDSPRAKDLSTGEFQDILVDALSLHLTTLYKLGARRILVTNVGPIGCTPYQLYQRIRQDGECDHDENDIIVAFNGAVKTLISRLNRALRRPHFLYLNSYDIVMEMITHPAKHGFEVVSKACCGEGGQYNAIIPCLPTVPVCANRTTHVFWDPYHPSDRAHEILTQRFYEGDMSDVYPMNIKHLLATTS